jgi:hypothetical protein
MKSAPKSNELKRIHTALKNVRIKEDQYYDVLVTIYAVLIARPDLLSNPNRDPLEDLCRRCAIELGSLPKSQPYRPSSQ